MLTLPEAAEELGVHYMTVYRYVRTGRLPALKEGAEYRVSRSDLREFTAATSPGSSVGRKRGKRASVADYHKRVEERLLEGDENGAWALIENALTAGLEPQEIHLGVLSPALVSIGERWSTGEVSVAQEHRASAVTQRLIGRLGPRFNRRGRKRGTVVVGAAPGDHHGIPSAMASDLLRASGFNVIDLGADPPPESWAETCAAAERLVAAAMAVTTTGGQDNARQAIRSVRAACDTLIVVGGHALPGPEDALELGADLWASDARDVVSRIEQASGSRL